MRNVLGFPRRIPPKARRDFFCAAIDLSDDLLIGVDEVLHHQFECRPYRFSGVKCVPEGRSSARSAVRHGNVLNVAAENRARLLQPIESRTQLRGDRDCIFGKDDYLDTDFLIAHTSHLYFDPTLY